MPYDPRLVAALEASPNHDIWREFRGSRLRTWLAERGVPYFDFTDIDSFKGRPAEFIDPVHASETAYLRILLEMAKNEHVRDMLRLDENRLRPWLAMATDLEVFRNTFSPVAVDNSESSVH